MINTRLSSELFSVFGLIILSAIWGSSFIFIKLSVLSIHPTMLTSYRLIIASIFLFFFCNIKKVKNLFKQKKKDLFIIAIFGNVLPFNLISWSQLYVDSLVASTIIGTMPLFTFLISLCFFKKSLRVKNFIGLLIGLMGLIVFLNPRNFFFTNDQLIYSLPIILASMMYAFSANWVKTVNEESSFELACCSIAFAAIFSLPLFFIILSYEEFNIFYYFSSITLNSFFSATVLGILCTGIAITLFFSLIRLRSAVFASQSNYLIPCFGFLWSYIFLEEAFTLNLTIGFILIVISGFIVNRA